mmetsp:Transcript_10837/g.27064  ORF Transcript_10837/g.27064 Transcript_10837/m.27064 type:complete len:202 (-) Transcript_10837:203-808(-)
MSKHRKHKPKYLVGCHVSLQRAKTEGTLKDEGALAELRLHIGEILYRYWFDVLVLVLVSMELLMTLIEFGMDYQLICINAAELDKQRWSCESKHGPRASAMLHNFETAGRAIVVFFSIEMLVKIFVGRVELFQNQWHVLDVAVVVINFAIAFVLNDLVEHRVEDYIGLALFLRYWRLLKIFRLVQEDYELIHELTAHDKHE